MSEWKEVKLGDLTEYRTDKVESDILNARNYISTDNLLVDREGIVDSEYVPESGRSSAYMYEDILVSNIRPYFKKIWFANNKGGCSNDILVFPTNHENIDPKFLYYQLSKDDFFDYMMSGANGTKMPRGNKKSILHYSFNLPSLSTQKKIAKILSNYDDLIENNLKRIKMLEESARLTYEEWFLRFRIDGEKLEIDSETGLPFGWEKRKFQNELEFRTGKLDSNATVEDGKYDFYTCAKVVYKTNTTCFNGEAILLGGNNATGDFSLFYANNEFDAYQRTYIVTSCIFPLVYVYFVMKNYLPYFKIISSGASTKFLTMRILNSIDIIFPYTEILDKYKEIVEPIFEEVLNLKDQNQLLKEARDILLPRLMTGMIDVDELEVAV